MKNVSVGVYEPLGPILELHWLLTSFFPTWARGQWSGDNLPPKASKNSLKGKWLPDNYGITRKQQHSFLNHPPYIHTVKVVAWYQFCYWWRSPTLRESWGNANRLIQSYQDPELTLSFWLVIPRTGHRSICDCGIMPGSSLRFLLYEFYVKMYTLFFEV